MTLQLNGTPTEVASGADGNVSVEALLAHLGLAGQPCAVEVNKAVVRKRDHASHKLQDGDAVEVVTLVGGG